MKKRNDWKAHVASSIRILAYISLAIWATSVMVSCRTQDKVSKSDVMEAVTNRVWYEHSMENCGRITGFKAVRNDSAVVITNRKIVVYDTSKAVRDTVTGAWTAPVAYEIVETSESSSGSVEQTDSVSVENTEVVEENRSEVDSAYTRESTYERERKAKTSSFGVFQWGIIIGVILVVVGLMWWKRLWIFK